MLAGDGADIVDAGRGADRVGGGGGGGDDTIDGDDRLYARAQADVAVPGADTIFSGEGDDGAGA